jgi:hypothetical protein
MSTYALVCMKTLVSTVCVLCRAEPGFLGVASARMMAALIGGTRWPAVAARTVLVSLSTCVASVVSMREPASRHPRLAVPVAVAVLALLSGCSSGDGEGPSPQVADAGAIASALGSDAHRAVPPGHCRGTIGAATVAEIRVPSGATCRLLGTTVTGNVSIGSGGRLVAHRTTVKGDVRGRGVRHVSMTARSLIVGNLKLAQGGSATISHAEIRADLEWTMQTGQLTVRQTIIRGDLTVNRNSGGLIFAGNRIDGDLQCHQNLRVPLRGDNLVGGQREGQCAGVGATATRYRSTRHPVWHRRMPMERPRPRCAGDSVSDDPSDDECGDD